ncbi:Phox homologous domain-containing protein [Mrakia frigida]|uniref:PX domain-containing protein YPT35 n=1 Tax=Mrakia frigida TaxID=29902 RepID=UPI003FCC03EC
MDAIPLSPPPSYETLSPLSPRSSPSNSVTHEEEAQAVESQPPPQRPILLTRISSSASDELHEEEFQDDEGPPSPASSSHHRQRTSSSTRHHSPILLLDNSNSSAATSSSSPASHHPSRPFASSVVIPSYTVVGATPGLPPPPSSWVVFHVEITIAETGGLVRERKRYSEFWELKVALRKAFPHLKVTIPHLPPKSNISKFRPSFLEKRRVRLQEWLRIVLLHPDIGSCPIVKEWLLM